METRNQPRLFALLAVGLAVSVALRAQVPPEQRKTRSPVSKAKEAEKTASSLYISLVASVVTISTQDSNREKLASGSGVVISRAGDVLTNYHVVEGGSFFEVTPRGSSPPLPFYAQALRCAPELDLAVIHPQFKLDLTPVSLSTSLPAVGDRVYALGSPLELPSTLSEGIVSQIRGGEAPVLIQTTAAISPGSSGGGLFDADGLLIGITSYTIKEGQALNFAVSVLSVRDLRLCDSFPRRLTSPFADRASTSEICPMLNDLVRSISRIAEDDKRAFDQYGSDLDSYTKTILELTRRMHDTGRIIQPPPGPSANVYHFKNLGNVRGLANDLATGHFDPILAPIRDPISLAVGKLAVAYDEMIAALSRDSRREENMRAASEAVGREWAAKGALLATLKRVYPQAHEMCPKISVDFKLDD